MSEQNIKRMYEAIAQIIADREKVKVQVTVSKKENAA